MADEFEDQDPTVEPIRHYNAIEEGAQRYWRASRIWRDHEESNWNYGMMIQELRDITCYRGSISPLAYRLLDDVVNDRRAPELQLQPEQIVQIPAKGEPANV